MTSNSSDYGALPDFTMTTAMEDYSLACGVDYETLKLLRPQEANFSTVVSMALYIYIMLAKICVTGGSYEFNTTATYFRCVVRGGAWSCMVASQRSTHTHARARAASTH